MFLADSPYLKALHDLSSGASKVFWPALATLVPTALTAIAKWMQDHTSKRRSVALTQRIAELAKMIADLPDLQADSSTAGISPRQALRAELDGAVRELTALQTRVSHGGSGVSTIAAKLRSAFLLYKPKGWLAATLHVAFFTYLVLFVIVVLMINTSDTSTYDSPTAAITAPAAPGATAAKPQGANVAKPESAGKSTAPTEKNDTAANVFAFFFIFGVAGIPPLTIRYFAARIHHRQCVAEETLKTKAAGAAAAPVPAPAQGT
jgi:hypothetical protein